MNGELENRIAELQQRGKAAKEQTAAELDRQKTALSEHAEGIKARLDRTVDVLTISSASTGDDVAYGAGLAYKIAAKTHVTADYMAYYNKNNIAIDGLAVGLRFRF